VEINLFKKVKIMRGKIILMLGLLVALIIFAAACGAPPDNPDDGNGDEEPSTVLSEAEQQVILSDFTIMLDSNVAETAAIAEIKNDLPLLSPENVSLMVLQFEIYQRDQIAAGGIITQELIDLIQAKMNEPYGEEAINDAAGIADPELQAAIQALLDRGYKIIVPEGMYAPVINYGVYRQFADYVTADIKAYIAIKAAESDQRMSEDAAIIIPISEVYSRLRLSEDFLGLYPDSQKYAEVKSMFDNYVSTYFYGQNNTPAFDYTTNTLGQEFRDSYQAAMADSATSAVAQAATNYLAFLSENDFTLSDAVNQYRNNLVGELTGTSSKSSS
jgi:hypothetical protein